MSRKNSKTGGHENHVFSLNLGDLGSVTSLSEKNKYANDELCALKMTNVYHSFGRQAVLNCLNLSVKYGTIYGLVGHNGCGKTTTLRIMIGLLKPSSGEVKILGERPNSPKSNVPGFDIGYLTQDSHDSLCKYLTIDESMRYYGRLNCMSDNAINDRIDELIKILNLPNKLRFVSSLNESKRRMLSIAMAIIHQPRLLILDEPTVGLDPLLRQTVWDLMKKMCEQEKVTIILTSHYIEEANESHTVGMMRNGKLSIEESPQVILSSGRDNSLEIAFRRISSDEEAINKKCLKGFTVVKKKQYETYVNLSDLTNLEHESETPVTTPVTTPTTPKTSKTPKTPTSLDLNKNELTLSPTNTQKQFVHQDSGVSGTSFASTKNGSTNGATMHKVIIKEEKQKRSKFGVLFWKNNIILRRNLASLLLQLILPALIITLLYYCLARNPMNINVGIVVVNGQHEDHTNNTQEIIRRFNESDTLNVIEFASLSSALNALKQGNIYAAITINETQRLFGNDDFNLRKFIGGDDKPRTTSISYEEEKVKEPEGEREELEGEEKDEEEIEDEPEAENVTRKPREEGLEREELSLEERDLDDEKTQLIKELSKLANQKLEIKVYVDKTRVLIENIIQDKVRDVIEMIQKQNTHSEGDINLINPIIKQIDINHRDSEDNESEKHESSESPQLIQLILPSLLPCIAFYSSMCLMVNSMMRQSGIIERSLANGMRKIHFLTVQLVSNILIVTAMTAIMFVLTFFHLHLDIHGSRALSFTLTLLQAICGLTFGLILSTLTHTKTPHRPLIIGSSIFLFTLLLSGIFWPIESLPVGLQYISLASPLTLNCSAMKCIVIKGCDWNELSVLLGFASSSLWIFAMLAVAMIIFNQKNVK